MSILRYLITISCSFLFCHFSVPKSVGLSSRHDQLVKEIVDLNNLARSLNKDATNQAIAYAYKAYLIAYENKLRKEQADAMIVLAEGYLYNDIYDLALEYGFNALEIFKETGGPKQIAETYTILGWIYYDVENAELSLKYHTLAYNIYKKLENEQKASVSLNAIGLSYQLKNQSRKAAIYFNKVLVLAKQYQNINLLSAAYNNLGITYNSTGNFQRALEYFHLSLKHSKGQPLALAEIHNQMALSQIKLGHYDDGKKSLIEALAFIEKSTSNSKKENLLDYYKIFSQLYQLIGDYKQAFQYIQHYHSVKEDLLSKNKINALLTLTMKRETQEKERQIKALNVEKSRQSSQRNSLVIIVILLLIIGCLLYNKMRNRQRKNAAIVREKQTMMTNKLEFNNVELKNYSMYLAHKNELINTFIEDLVTIEKSRGEDTIHRLHKLVVKFRYNVNSEKNMEFFNLQIENKYQDFFYNLQQKFPMLTQNEKRLCAQIRLNLHIKEIASLNNISVKSVEMARYRLRKSFDLSTNDSLNEFLKSF